MISDTILIKCLIRVLHWDIAEHKKSLRLKLHHELLVQNE